MSRKRKRDNDFGEDSVQERMNSLDSPLDTESFVQDILRMGSINEEYYCRECGTRMVYLDEYVVRCPNCGESVDKSSYNFWYESKYEEDLADAADEHYKEVFGEYPNDLDEMPEVCKTCGGPYPDCMTSCKIFDD